MAEDSDPPSAPDRRYDVFISYAHADQAWVAVLAENLHHAGLEVFFDQWEIGPGDVFVRVLDRGLAQARSGALVVSPTALARPWVQQEYAALLAKAVGGGAILIPVLLADAEMPPMLATRQWVDFRHADGATYAARVAELVAALKGERKGPPPRQPGHLAPPPGTGYRAEGPIHRTLRIDPREAVLLGGTQTAAAPVAAEDHAFEERLYQLERELHRRGEAPLREEGGTSVQAAAERLHHCQLEAGAALGRVYLPAPVAAALRTDLEAAERSGASLWLGLEMAEELLEHPWETLCLAPGEPLALHPRVGLYRSVRGLGATPALRVPGPLRILVAIGSPETQNARRELLDMEAELARILDAVEPARKAGRPAHVRILEHGTVAAIAEALAAERYHVLHLSCHAGPGVLVLEDGEGGEDLVDAARLVNEALPGDRGVPLVVLAGCATAVEGEGEKALPGLARGLLARGVPAVLAMRAAVSDGYATALAGAFYRALATAEEPLPLRAFVEARRAVESTRRAGEVARARAEWSTPVLFLRGEGAAAMPLYDPKAPPAPVAAPQTVRLAAGVLVRRVGDFVGRRSDQRRILRVLREGEVGGVLVRGLGGVGKSTLSAQLAQKLGAEGWLAVSLFGAVDPEGILEEVGRQLLGLAVGAKLPEDHPLRELAQLVRRRDLDPGERLELLAQSLLEQQPLVLLLDNFEDNLAPLDAGAWAFRSEQLAAFLSAWLERPGQSRLLVTCRYPVPLQGLAARRLRDHPLAPLSLAETRKLIWRLPALDACSEAEQERAWAGVGGHPRALEYLDALLRGGKARFEDVAVRLEAALEKKGVADPRAWLAARGGDFDVALAETVTLAADDVLLEGLLERLRPVPLAERLLLGAAVYRVAVEETALVWQVGEVPGLPRDKEPDPMPEVAVPAGFEKARAVLEELGLLAPVEGAAGGRRFTVHRWTASRLEERSAGEERKAAHRRAACYWRWHFAKAPQSREQDMLDLLEARHHHHQAGELEQATLVTEWVCSQLQTWGAYRREEQLIHELLGWLPERHEKTAVCFGQLGNVAYLRGDYDQALDWYRKALQIDEELGNRAGMANAYHQIGIVTQERGDYDQALDGYRKALQINEELRNHAGMASSYGQLGIGAQLRGDHDQAFDGYRKALQIFEKLGNRAGMAASYQQLGMLAQDRGDFDQAFDGYRKALQIFEELGNRAGMAHSYHHLGMVAQYHRDYNLALDGYRKSLQIREELGDRAGMASSYSQIGVLFTERGEPAEAVPLNLQSLAIRLQLQSPQIRINLHWLRRQREQLGDERFRAILSEHLDADSLAAVWEMIESAPGDTRG